MNKLKVTLKVNSIFYLAWSSLALTILQITTRKCWWDLSTLHPYQMVLITSHFNSFFSSLFCSWMERTWPYPPICYYSIMPISFSEVITLLLSPVIFYQLDIWIHELPTYCNLWSDPSYLLYITETNLTF